jgi:Xaa-Pro aminopeptidase
MSEQLTTRLQRFRQQLGQHQLDGFIIGREDMYQGEEVPPADERLAYISGFTGSAGFAMITTEAAALFSDGRYTLQMQAQTGSADWHCHTLPNYGLDDWLDKHPIDDQIIGIDPRLVTVNGFDRYDASISCAGGTLQMVDSNPIDEIWQEQPDMPPPAAWRMDTALAGQSMADKLAALADHLRQENLQAVLLSRVDAVNWLVNMRGGDLPFTPVNLCFALFDCDNGLTLLGDGERLAPVIGQTINIAPLADLASLLTPLAGKRLLVEPASLPKALASVIAASDADMVEENCPVTVMKARKNQMEIDGFHRAHRHDGVAMVRFLHWLEAIRPADYTESQIAEKLEQFRADHAEFLVPSFATIAGAGPNGAIVHYRAIAGADRRLANGDILLLDSGGHYHSGTTDITRTLLLGDAVPTVDVKDAFTHVLRGHIALATAHFETGATGQQLDGIARAPLWAAGLQFAHGTGHGVGHVLSVHEGPASISKRGGVPIEAGMVLSNEPGYYLPGHYGIRLENLIAAGPAADNGFICFDTLTLCPFDRRLIRADLLSASERGWLDDYHHTVLTVLSPLLPDDCQRWLSNACAPL